MMNLINHKYSLTVRLLDKDVSSLLDVGCRDAVLKEHLPTTISYTGLDLFPGPRVDHVVNVEQGIPFADQSYDAVVALDLLEHTNDIWFVYDELMRVARKQVIIILPNAYHWSYRIWYVVGKEMNKYILPGAPILDRHRWLLSYHSACRFCFQRAEARGWSISEMPMLGSRRTSLVDWTLCRLSKNLGALGAVFVLKRGAGPDTANK